MLKIRLARGGKRNDPFYRIIAIDERKKREGKAIETLGFWHPAKDTKKVDTAKIEEWRSKGAVVTKAVEKLALDQK
jgi:small subunit ribosomal protein S16